MGRRSHNEKNFAENFKSWLRSLLPVIGIAILILLAYWFWLLLTNKDVLPIQHIQIVASNTYIKPPELEHVIEKNIDGGFFSLDIQRLKQALLQQQWVNKVSVRRVWPDTLVLTIQEQKPVARWGDKGAVNEDGVAFYPELTSIPDGLPTLMGPKDSSLLVLREYIVLNTLLVPLKLSIRELSLTERNAWDLQLNNGIEVVLGREDVESRFAEFVSVYPRVIGERSANVKCVDMRYPNGFAIQWR